MNSGKQENCFKNFQFNYRQTWFFKKQISKLELKLWTIFHKEEMRSIFSNDFILPPPPALTG